MAKKYNMISNAAELSEQHGLPIIGTKLAVLKPRFLVVYR
jgi:hypothetical protein